MASSLAARAAARQGMVPAINPQQNQQPQGFLDRNRNFIENLIGLGGDAAGAWNQYQRNMGGQERAALHSPEFAAKVAEFSKTGKDTQGILAQGDQTQQSSPTSQLSDLLQKLMAGKIDQMSGGATPTTSDELEEKAYATAHNQMGDQPVPSYQRGPNFPWEQLGMAALNRLGGEPTFAESMTQEQADARDPNWLRNRIVGQAPQVLEAGGRLVGRVAGGMAGAGAGPAGILFGANTGGELGAGGGALVGSAIKRFGTAQAPRRVT